MSVDSRNMASRAVGAGAWSVGTRLTAKLIDLGMLLCLARFLGPAEFGLVATAMAVVFIVEALFELPMAAALIRVPVLTPAMLHTAFTLSLLRGLVIALLLLALSYPLSVFNNEPRLIGLFAVLALAPAMRGLVSPRMVEFARAFNFRPDAAIELSGKVVAFTISVAIAVTTRSYWAIAAATVCSPMAATLLSYYIAPLRPHLTLSHWTHFSSLIGWNFITQLCSALNWQIDRLLLPRLTTNAMFGQYAMGKQISEIPFQALTQPLVRPAMAALASAGDRQASRYLQLSRAIALVMIPALGVPLLWPEALVRVALGTAWSQAAEWLRWTSAVGLLGIPALLMAPLAMTLDRTRWVAVRTLIELLVRMPLVWLGAVQLGILGAIAGSAVATACGTAIALFMVRKLIGTTVSDQVMALLRPVLALAPAGAVLWFAKPLLTAAGSVTELLMWAVPLGMLYLLIYAAVVWLLWRLSGRPAGLERHLSNSLYQLRLKGASGSQATTGPKPTPQDPRKTHAKQLH